MDKNLIKDRECIKCERFWDCKGKPRGVSCVTFTPKKEKADRRVRG